MESFANQKGGCVIAEDLGREHWFMVYFCVWQKVHLIDGVLSDLRLGDLDLPVIESTEFYAKIILYMDPTIDT